MKWRVKIYISGKVYNEMIPAANRENAKLTAIARFPKTKILSIDPVL